MAKLSVITLSLIVWSATAHPDSIQLNRVVRSPHYGSFEFHPFPPPPYPFFQTNNWSGITKTSDGNTQGVYSGASASARNTGSTSGQALSLASADCDDDTSGQSGVISGKESGNGFTEQGHGGVFGGYGGHFSSQKESHYSSQSGGGKFGFGDSFSDNKGHLQTGGIFDISKNGNGQAASNGFASANSQSSNFAKENVDGQQQVELINGGLQRGDQGQSNLITSNQSGFGGFKHQEQGGGLAGYKESGVGQQTGSNGFENTQFGRDFNKQQEGSGLSTIDGKQDTNGVFKFEGQHNVGFDQGGFSQQHGQHELQQTGGFLQSQENIRPEQQNAQTGLAGSGTGQASSYSYGRGFGYNRSFPGYGRLTYGRHYDNSFDNSRYQESEKNQAQQKQSESEFTNNANEATQGSGSHDSSSTIGGALNLASQSLDAAKKAGCSTCNKEGGYAFSNAKSHSGSAIAVAIGG
ncbi:unnamed protein product [Leptosia nina]|uniref:Uncharacterized protein n=1 Tax=Leptosia nina TaxID=320188 RepID=A0AAV1J4Q8_9NEOP